MCLTVAHVNHIDDGKKLSENFKDKEKIYVKEIGILNETIDKLKNIIGGTNDPFLPETSLSAEIETKCLALGIFYEARDQSPHGREITAWAAVNRAIDGRINSQFKSSVCAVLASTTQFESMTAENKSLLTSIVWGEVKDPIPKQANANAIEMKAWNEISELARQIMFGERSRKTLANHFISFKAMKGRVVPTWVGDLKPVEVADLHVFFVDYVDTEKGRVYLTKEKPYKPSKHNRL